jgi:hypothetical protein
LIYFPHCIAMSLDTKLILDAISEFFDNFDARWAAWEASRRVPVPTQSAAVRADVVADNWGDLFDSGNDSVEQHYEEPIIADNWGGFFNDGEQYCVELDALPNNIHLDLLNSSARHSHDHIFVLNPVVA